MKPELTEGNEAIVKAAVLAVVLEAVFRVRPGTAEVSIQAGRVLVQREGLRLKVIVQRHEPYGRVTPHGAVERHHFP